MIIKEKNIEIGKHSYRRVIEATCDICGADCMKEIFSPKENEGDDNYHDISKDFEGMELKATWGYGSDKDGEIWKAVVCEKCVDEHLIKKINFLKTSYL